jgi:hypothetical protein
MAAMRFRKLRIAFSAMCGIAAVLLIALWARSYWKVDRVYLRPSAARELAVWHARGEIILWTNDLREQDSQHPDGSTLINSWPIEEYPVRRMKFDYSVLAYGTDYGVPYWFPVLLVVILAGIPWIPLPKKFNRLTILVTILVALIVVFLVVGLLTTINYDLNTTCHPRSTEVPEIQPPHSANRHDVGCRGTGGDRVA